MGNAYFLCLVQVTRIYIADEETLLSLFWQVSAYQGARKKQLCIKVWTIFVLNCTPWLFDLYKHTSHCKHLRNFMLYSFYRKIVRHIRKFKSCRKVAVNYRFGALIFIHQNKQIWLFIAEVCAWPMKSRASRLSRYKSGNLLYRWKEIFFDFFWHVCHIMD